MARWKKPLRDTGPSLFDDLARPEPPAQRHSDTSVAAADAIAGHAETLRARVHRFLVERGTEGATDEEMQTLIPMPASTQRPRRCELVEAGLATDSGARRKTASGRDAVVWLALEAKG